MQCRIGEFSLTADCGHFFNVRLRLRSSSAVSESAAIECSSSTPEEWSVRSVLTAMLQSPWLAAYVPDTRSDPMTSI